MEGRRRGGIGRHAWIGSEGVCQVRTERVDGRCMCVCMCVCVCVCVLRVPRARAVMDHGR